MDLQHVKLNNPEAILPSPSIGAGLTPDQQSIYKFAYPSSKYPTLILPNSIYNDSGNELPNGFYSVALSDNKKFLLLFQSCNLKAKVPVVSLTEHPITKEEYEQEAALKAQIEKYDKKWNKRKMSERQEELKNLYTRRNALVSAKIKDSGNGYYILLYRDQVNSAQGYIAK